MKRSDARASAMKLVYEWDMGGEGGESTVSGMLELSPEEAEYGFMQKVVEGVKANITDIDAKIAKFISTEWEFNRIAKVDLAILRVAVYELDYTQTPKGVIINEAVELARKYSGDKAFEFVNGVLGTVTRGEQQ